LVLPLLVATKGTSTVSPGPPDVADVAVPAVEISSGDFRKARFDDQIAATISMFKGCLKDLMGMSENGVYPQKNNHLVGIMIINHWV